MIRKFAIALLLIYMSPVRSGSCQLLINGPNYYQSTLGAITFATFNENYILLGAGMGNKTTAFNTNMDYEVVTGAGSYYFRLNGIAYNPTGTKQTYIYDIAWAFNMVPHAVGTYTVNAYNSTKNPIFYRYIDTIGDSITWAQSGRFLRCLMRDAGLHYDFIGSQTDVFGFGHDGKGGNTTLDVLARMALIPISDAYFVLIGTNDKTDSQHTFDNIVLIAQQLKVKNPCAKVYISTLLPRNDANNSLIQDINTLLRNSDTICDGCTLIDTGAYVYNQPNWTLYFNSDGIHPNSSGYKLIAHYLAALLK